MLYPAAFRSEDGVRQGAGAGPGDCERAHLSEHDCLDGRSAMHSVAEEQSVSRWLEERDDRGAARSRQRTEISRHRFLHALSSMPPPLTWQGLTVPTRALRRSEAKSRRRAARRIERAVRMLRGKSIRHTVSHCVSRASIHRGQARGSAGGRCRRRHPLSSSYTMPRSRRPAPHRLSPVIGRSRAFFHSCDARFMSAPSSSYEGMRWLIVLHQKNSVGRPKNREHLTRRSP